MTPMLQKLPVSVYSIFTFKEVIPYVQAPERGEDEALLQVIAKVEVALFVVAAAGLFNDPRDKTRGPSPRRRQDGDENYHQTQPTQGIASYRTVDCTVQAVEEPRDHIPDAGS